MLTGSQYLVAPPDDRGRSPLSRRSFPLSWLTDLPRLKTLVVHINESGKQYVRRGTENAAVKRFMAAKTAGQPNTRMTRALRCVQGIDSIYKLRGLEFVKFYDFQKALDGDGGREPVRDWSFVEDVTNVVTMPKVPKREEEAQLKTLARLFPEDQNWQPGADDWELVKPFFIESNGRCSYDELRNRDMDMASALSGSTAADDGSDGPDADESNDGIDNGNDSSDNGNDSDGGFLVSIPGADGSHESDIDSERESSESGQESGLESLGPGSIDSAIIISDSSDSDSDSSDSDSDSPFISSRASFSPTPLPPSLNPRRASTSSGLFMTPGPRSRSSSTLSRSARTTLSPKRRESTGLFVTPGPSGRVDTPRHSQRAETDEDGRTVIDLTEEEEEEGQSEGGFQLVEDLSSAEEGADDEDDELDDGENDMDDNEDDTDESDDGELEFFGVVGSGLKRTWSGGSQGSGKRARLES